MEDEKWKRGSLRMQRMQRMIGCIGMVLQDGEMGGGLSVVAWLWMVAQAVLRSAEVFCDGRWRGCKQ